MSTFLRNNTAVLLSMVSYLCVAFHTSYVVITRILHVFIQYRWLFKLFRYWICIHQCYIYFLQYSCNWSVYYDAGKRYLIEWFLLNVKLADFQQYYIITMNRIERHVLLGWRIMALMVKVMMLSVKLADFQQYIIPMNRIEM